MDKLEHLRGFIEFERKKRGISASEFARLAGVDKSTITRITDPRDSASRNMPTIETLVGIARATGVNLCYLVGLIEPEAANIDPRIGIISAYLSEMPDADLEKVSAYIVGLSFQAENKT